jgi:hypothetical protein
VLDRFKPRDVDFSLYRDLLFTHNSGLRPIYGPKMGMWPALNSKESPKISKFSMMMVQMINRQRRNVTLWSWRLLRYVVTPVALESIFRIVLTLVV